MGSSLGSLRAWRPFYWNELESDRFYRVGWTLVYVFGIIAAVCYAVAAVILIAAAV